MSTQRFGEWSHENHLIKAHHQAERATPATERVGELISTIGSGALEIAIQTSTRALTAGRHLYELATRQ